MKTLVLYLLNVIVILSIGCSRNEYSIHAYLSVTASIDEVNGSDALRLRVSSNKLEGVDIMVDSEKDGLPFIECWITDNSKIFSIKLVGRQSGSAYGSYGMTVKPGKDVIFTLPLHDFRCYYGIDNRSFENIINKRSWWKIIYSIIIIDSPVRIITGEVINPSQLEPRSVDQAVSESIIRLSSNNQ